jgi:hypothetical protein
MESTAELPNCRKPQRELGHLEGFGRWFPAMTTAMLVEVRVLISDNFQQ